MKLLLLLSFIFAQLITDQSRQQDDIQTDIKIIIDCSYTFEEAISGIEIPSSIISELRLVEVEYYSFDDKLHRGQLLVNKKVEEDIIAIFSLIKGLKFPIANVIPAVKYNWDDEASMNDNNTVAFNYRKVKGSKMLSAHSYGMAIDINPIQNPHVKGKVIQPPNAKYDSKVKGTILRDSELVKEFIKRGWQWGGRWKSSKDYQHFEKKN
jgi:peptidoglycan LD-endopeptidase CwlK